MFGTVPQAAIRRRPSDVVRVLAAAVLLVLLAWAAERLTGLEAWVLELLAGIPRSLEVLWRSLYVGGAVLATVPLVLAALAGRRWRLVATMLGAAAVTAAAGLVLRSVVEPVGEATVATAGVGWSGTVPPFPALPLAVAAAVVVGAAPLLTRPTRRLLALVLAIVTLAALLLLEALPGSVIGSVALAWGAAAVVHLVLGTPAGIPNTADVVTSLAAVGVPAEGLHLVEVRDGGEAGFVAPIDDSSRLAVTVLGRDATGARLASALLRRIWLRDAPPVGSPSRVANVEHRAFLLLLAERAGVAVPTLVAAGTAGELDDALLVTAEPCGVPLDELGPDGLTDGLLDDAWRNIARLHGALVVHGDLRAGHVLRRADGSAAIVDFADVAVDDGGMHAAVDDATFLVTTAALVGPERALDALERNLGRDAVEAVLPLLQPAALPAGARRSVPGLGDLLGTLREGAAVRLGVEPPELVELRRVPPANLLMAAGAVLGVYLLLGELANVEGLSDVLQTATWGWVVLAFGFSQLPQLAQAVGMLGSVSARLPVGPATGVQFANQFMGLVGGTVATTALVIRFFQKEGLGPAVAVSSGLLNTLATMVTQAILVGAGLLTTRGDWQLPSATFPEGEGASRSGTAVVIILVVAAVTGAALAVPRLRRRVIAKIRPQLALARANLREVWGQPRKAVQLFGGTTAAQLLFALTLWAALAAYGVSLPLLQIVVVNSFASLIGGIAPVPGGMGVIEAGLIGGFVAAGVPQAEATAATLTARTFTAYLPPIWGWFALRWLQRRDYI